MKRRFRQKQNESPKKDHEKDKGLTKDSSVENVDIDNVIEEIDTHIKHERVDKEKK